MEDRRLHQDNVSYMRHSVKERRRAIAANGTCDLFPRATLGKGDGFSHGLGDPAIAGFWRAVIENAEQLTASLRRRHALPSCEGAGIARERDFQYRWEFAFRFHDGEQTLSELSGSAQAGFRAFHLQNPRANFPASRIVELFEPAAQPAVFVEVAFELAGHSGLAFFRVWFESKVSDLARTGVGAGLHALVDEQSVTAFARRKERSAKSKSVNFALHPQLSAFPPDFRNIKRDANDYPPEARGRTLEHGSERFRTLFAGCLHRGLPSRR